MCFRPAAVGLPKPKCPACNQEVEVQAGMTACPECGHEFTQQEIDDFSKPAFPAPGMPAAPGMPTAPGMPGAPSAPSAPKPPTPPVAK
jgi:hypothetical protein